MAVRINLEIGHEASLRTKFTPEGFTHDWKIYVRGCDGAEIHHYIDKIVFNLHETFQKPRRVVKEPPYQVKESGYAGFILPIDIYLRNSGEPKKIRFTYDLTLRHESPVSNVRKEKYVFFSPPEDFKSKLLKGGGTVTSNSQESNESKSVLYEEKNQLVSKPKLGGTDAPQRKPKIDSHISNSFQDLFGTPITKTTKMPEAKAPPPKENKVNAKPDREKSVDKVKSKHSPHKEKDKERDKTDKKVKDEKKRDKDRKDRDRERSKEKSFRKEKSPKQRSPSPKHQSPKPSSPPPQAVPSIVAGKSRDKDIKGEKDKKDKTEKEEKKAKKDKKEKEHNKDKDKHRDSSKSDHKIKEIKPKEIVTPPKEPELPTPTPPAPAPSPPPVKVEKKERVKEEEKPKIDRIDKPEDKKHKHKKKDKNKKDRKEKEDKSHKNVKKPEKEKEKVMAPPQAAPSSTVTSVNGGGSGGGGEISTEKNALFGNSPKTETSSVTSSPKEKEKPAKPLNKLFSSFLDEPTDSSSSSPENSPIPESRKKERARRNHKRNADKKKKRKASSDLEQPPEKVTKDVENLENNSDMEVHSTTSGNKSEATVTAPELSDGEYMNALRNLQHRIMAIKDNEDLQRVVQLIADTGQYEISANTFDFDLCLLDRTTVKMLEDFISTLSHQ